ncbi:MAG: CDP-glycerol glycerophosphotransferase family protein [Lachnospiraceae bacterium]
MKTLGYLLYAGIYQLCRLFPVREKQIFCVMTHDPSDGSNIGRVVAYIKEQDPTCRVYKMTKRDKRKPLSFYLCMPYRMARSSHILLDNVFLPMAYMKLPSQTKVIQLWHGTGTIKKFGQDSNEGLLKQQERMANSKITHMTVNSTYWKHIYAHAFGIPEERIIATGLPRTDVFFDEAGKKKLLADFYQQYPQCRGKRVVLYAPTFRDAQQDCPQLPLDTAAFIQRLPEDCVLLLRLHPHVAEAFEAQHSIQQTESSVAERTMDATGYGDINGLLVVADVLVTDYSSIIFEYCLMKKPIVFYAYDLESFSESGRGFYEDYESFVPGPVVRTQQELADCLSGLVADEKRLQTFIEQNYDFLDGKSTERVVELF